jgi:class 3 adenylate cyclase
MPKSENLTVLITDIADFTAKMANSSRADMRSMLRLHDRLLKRTVHFYEGRYIKSTGDGMLSVFRGTTNAVQCGMAIQDTVAEYNQGVPPENRLRVRVALDLGDVGWTSRKDIAGDAVNIAARIETITPPDEIYISGTVYQAMNKTEAPSEFVDNVNLKGIEAPIAIYRIPRGQTRLVATGEPVQSGNADDVLPYGGMPRPSAITAADRIRNTLSKGWVVGVASATAAVLLLVIVAWNAKWMSPEAEEAVARVLVLPVLDLKKLTALGEDRALLRQGTALLEQAKLEELRLLLTKTKVEGRARAETLLLEGHLLFEERKLGQSVQKYAQALDTDPELRVDGHLARNLVSSLGYVSQPAMELIRKYHTQAMNEYLAERTGTPGRSGRRYAVSLLQSLGQENRVNYYQNGLLGLREANSCEDYKEAIASLRRSGDKRAIAALIQARGEGPVAWFQSLCWAEDADAAIVALRKY